MRKKLKMVLIAQRHNPAQALLFLNLRLQNTFEEIFLLVSMKALD